MIEDYSFGHITIDGTAYSSDLIIYPDGTVADGWWRKSGHRLEAADIEGLIAASPEVIVAGTGNSGLMKPDPQLEEELHRKNIELVARPSAEAADIYNRLAGQRKTGACFHLTC